MAIEVEADPSSLEVSEGLHGINPLSDADRMEIRQNIDDKVLRGGFGERDHALDYGGCAWPWDAALPGRNVCKTATLPGSNHRSMSRHEKQRDLQRGRW